MKSKKIKSNKRELNAKTFQKQLDELADTIALKIQREGSKHSIKPIFVIPDIYYMLRQAHQTYNFFFFMNADERRQKDVFYKVAYSAVILPLVRTMIDCLYNITAILKNPGPRGYQFRESGLKQILKSLDADEKRYGGDPQWDAWIAQQREKIDFDMRRNGITQADVNAAEIWPTLGRYLQPKKHTTLTPHQQFLRKLTYGFWQEYSGMSHATFQGLLPIAVFLAPKDLPHELRPILDNHAEELVSLHLPRVSALLLCILTEVQSYFKFDGAHINERLHKIWDALRIVPEIKELYDERYAQLMHEKGINP